MNFRNGGMAISNFVSITCGDVCSSLCNGYEEMANVMKSGTSWRRDSFERKHFCNCPAEHHLYLLLLPLDQECSLESAEVVSPNGTV